MSPRIWDGLLSDRDRLVIERSGYGREGATNYKTRGWGDSPLVLVIDMQRFILGPEEPIEEAVRESRIVLGNVGWTALREHIAPFIDSIRGTGVPIVHTRMIPPAYDDPDHRDLQFVEELTPLEDEVVIEKEFPSALYGTSLLSRLIRWKVDTLVVVGNTTSGCVRATITDAQQYGFKVIVPEECVFDRLEAAHKVGLLNIWMKYGEVLPTEEVQAHLTSDGSAEAA
ncbi:isochorismatase family protein (plasmid) [Haloferax sp. S1W]|uniref:isochorismatase family protein n=1 Tax=Haloferax sp. S1W TaxID=3377110 RepID=UPI0037C95363